MNCVLVAGATGFIGQRLVNRLRGVATCIKVLSRRKPGGDSNFGGSGPKVIPIVADLSHHHSINNICDGVDTVFHLAGYAHVEDADSKLAAVVHQAVTVTGTRTLLQEACRAGVKRLVFVSSAKAIGEGSEECADETAPASPVTEYGRAKLEAEQLVLELGRDCGMHVCVLRLPLVYGPGVKGNLLHMIRAIDGGRFPPVPDVHNKRSMVHVDDVVQALCIAVERPKACGEVYLVTDGRAYSIYDICSQIRRALGRAEPNWNVPIGVLRAAARIGDVIGGVQGRPFFFNSVTLDKLVGSAWYSAEKIERDLGFRPTHTFETALPEIVEEYRRRAR